MASIAAGPVSAPVGWRTMSEPALPVRLAALFGAALALSGVALLLILALTGMRLSFDLARFPLLALFLMALALFCRFRRYDWRMGDSAAAFGLATVSLLLCGLVSVTGLRLGLPIADAALLRVDRQAGFDTTAVLGFMIARALLIDVLYWTYSLSGPLCLVAILWNLIRKERVRLWQIVATIIVAMQLTALVSVFVPARGAILFMGLDALQGQGLPVGAGSYFAPAFAHFYWGSDPLVTLEKMNGIVAFPSFHTVMALVILQGFAASPLRWVAVLWCALTIVSTIPMGGHYVADLAGGMLVWIAAYLLAKWACSEVRQERKSA